MWTDADTPGRDAVDEPALGRVARRSRSASARRRASRSATRTSTRTTCPTTASPGCPPTPTCRSRSTRTQAPPVDFQQLLRPHHARLRGHEDRPRDRAASSTTSAARSRLRALGCATAARRATRSITAPRFVSASTPAPTSTGSCKSRDMDGHDRGRASSTSSRASATGAVEHAAGRPASRSRDETSENYLRIGPRRPPLADLFDPNPSDAVPGPDHAHRRRQRRAPPTRWRPTRSTP